MANVGASWGAIETGHRREIGVINLAGPIQGMALVTFPAASYIFTSPHGYGFKPPRYGMVVYLVAQSCAFLSLFHFCAILLHVAP